MGPILVPLPGDWVRWLSGLEMGSGNEFSLVFVAEKNPVILDDNETAEDVYRTD